MEQLIPTKAASEVIGMSEAYLIKMRTEKMRAKKEAGSIPYYKIGRTVRYKREDLERWIDERRHGGER